MSSWPTTSLHGVSAVNFDFMTTQDWDTALATTVEHYKTQAKDLSERTDVSTFDNTLVALERSSSALNDIFGALHCAKSHATEDIQELVSRWSPIVTEVYSEVLQNEQLFSRLQSIPTAHLTSEQKKLHEDWLWEFKEAGCGRTQQDKDRVRELKTDLSRLETEFENINLKNANNTIAVKEKCLEGAPEGFLDNCVRALKDGVEYVCVPVNSAHVEPLLETVNDRDTRQKLWTAWTGRGTGLGEGDLSTAHLMRDILSKRSELSHLLGYNNWAEYMMARRMEKDPSTILAMLQTTWDSLNAAAQGNIDELQRWVLSENGPEYIEAWDVPYYSAKRQKSQNSLLQDVNVKDYLPLPAVRKAAFQAAEKLFGLTFEEDPSIPTYHPDVVGYIVREGSSVIGTLLVDDYARPSKEPGAWMNVFASGHQLEKGNNAGVINVLNIPPSSTDTPALLSYDEMITVFHELGHALHGLLGKTTYPSHSGTNVSRDFVELPSQLLENWGNNPECFLNMARHWKTNNPLSAEVFSQMNEGTFLDARFMKIAYLQSAFVDLKMHMQTYAGEDVGQWQEQIVSQLNAPKALPQRHFASHFSHVFGGGYAAGYYSYLWAEILEADIASRFENNFANPNPSVCNEVKKLYKAGGSVDAMELFVRMQGRPPEPTALLERLGIAPIRKSTLSV